MPTPAALSSGAQSFPYYSIMKYQPKEEPYGDQDAVASSAGTSNPDTGQSGTGQYR